VFQISYFSSALHIVAHRLLGMPNFVITPGFYVVVFCFRMVTALRIIVTGKGFDLRL